MEVIKKAGSRVSSGMGAGGMQAPGGGMMAGIPASLAAAVNEQASSGHNVTFEMVIPGPKCGLVIGKGGETIKLLQVHPVSSIPIQSTV